MLTLFKPWQSGLELKVQDQSWDDAFSTYCFSVKQKDVMRNFNIQYECLDAQDDFHVQLNKGDVSISSWEDPDMQMMQDMDDMATDANIQDGSNIEHPVPNFSDEPGKQEKTQSHLMSKMRAMLQNLGWTDNIPGLLDSVVDIRPPPPGVKQNGAAWKTVVMQKHAEALQQHSQHMPTDSNPMPNPGIANNQFVPDNICVVTKSYLSCFFVSKEWQAMIEDISSHFHLNQEQNCAFRIVTNHTCDPDSEHLKMYIGSMAGTGKSQVLHALTEFFSLRKELYRLLILAPTGSTAALLCGSTYHSVLGINTDGDRTSNSNTQLSQIRSRLVGVQYIFLDEVLMLLYREMYLISARLVRVLNNQDTAFGGMNMIFAGNFAQLPPAIGRKHALLYSRTVGRNPTSLYDQQAAIGKALWH